MSILQWAAIGALALGMLVICARVMRRGVRTLDENRKEWRENMRQTEKRIEKDRKNISSAEHLNILRAAMEDLLRLDGLPEGHEVLEKDGCLELRTPKGVWRVKLSMRERGLKSSGRVLRGKCRWDLEGFGIEESHMDPASLMRSLNEHLHESHLSNRNEEESHIARRMSHLPQEPRRARGV